MCCWPLPAQSFSGPSPLGLETIFYCLTFETSLFVASYDSQGNGRGIRPRLPTGKTALIHYLSCFSTTLHGPKREHRSQQFLYCCLRIRCRGNLFTEPLPSSGRLLLLYYYGLRVSCQNITAAMFVNTERYSPWFQAGVLDVTC
jgi:hypothetical protein